MTKQLTSADLNSLSESDALVSKARKASSLGYHDFAETYLTDAARLRKAVLGEDDAGVAELENDLGAEKTELGKYEEAHALFDKALTTLKAKYYDGHFKIGPVCNNLATCYIRQGKFEPAEEVTKQALDVFSKTLHGEHRLILEATYKLATIYKQLNRNADALKLFAKVKKGIESPLGPIDEFKFLEATIQESEGKIDEAEKAFKAAIDAFKSRKNFHRLGQCMVRYAEFLRRRERLEEAEAVSVKAGYYKAVSTNHSRNDDLFCATLMKA